MLTGLTGERKEKRSSLLNISKSQIEGKAGTKTSWENQNWTYCRSRDAKHQLYLIFCLQQHLAPQSTEISFWSFLFCCVIERKKDEVLEFPDLFLRFSITLQHSRWSLLLIWEIYFGDGAEVTKQKKTCSPASFCSGTCSPRNVSLGKYEIFDFTLVRPVCCMTQSHRNFQELNEN